MITHEQHSTTIAKKVVGKFVEDIEVKDGFSGLFPSETTRTLLVDVEVERDNDLIAVDVQRFTEGNKNKFTRSTEHTYKPPFYKEDYDFARDEVYMNTVSLGVTDNSSVNQLIAKNALKNVRKNKKKIVRAIRKQQAEVLQTGIVTLKNGDNIDYKRKAASLAVVTTAWSDRANATPIEDLIKGTEFLRDEGNSNGAVINLVMRTKALNNLLSNEALAKEADNRRINRADVIMPEMKASGMTFHGQITVGDYKTNLWTYNQKYTNAQGNTEYYLDEDNVVMLPDDFKGKTIYGGLAYMRKSTIKGVTVKMPAIKEADFLLRAYDDEKTMSSTLELTSAPLVVPFTIDKVYTLKVEL